MLLFLSTRGRLTKTSIQVNQPLSESNGNDHVCLTFGGFPFAGRAHNLTIHSDGVANLFIHDGLSIISEYRKEILDHTKVQEIFELLLASRFYNLRDKYQTDISVVPSDGTDVRIAATLDGRQKIIEADLEATPETLQKLVNHMIGIARSVQEKENSSYGIFVIARKGGDVAPGIKIYSLHEDAGSITQIIKRSVVIMPECFVHAGSSSSDQLNKYLVSKGPYKYMFVEHENQIYTVYFLKRTPSG